MATVRTRIAPSPTGFPHLGLIYQAMFDVVLVRKYGGAFILRIEDTDRARFVEGAEDVIYKSLEWVNLLPDESPKTGGDYAPYRQSERLELYQKYVKELIEKEHAYYCFCTRERLDEMRKKQEENHQAPMYDKHCRNLPVTEVEQKLKDSIAHVVRMKIPENQQLKVHDEIVGEIVFDTNLIDEQVILKSDGFPTYHLAVVVDDYLMGITHVFRGTEWVPSYPKHVLLWQYFGWQDKMPKFIHIPLLLNSEGGGKLSKRHAHTSVDYYRDEGFLPEAVLNYLANIVWNHPEEKEIFSLEEFGQAFDLENNHFDIRTNGVRFDLQKLLWMNGEYIRAMSDQELTKRLEDFLVDHPDVSKVAKLVPLVKERIKKLSDFVPLTNFIFVKPEQDADLYAKLKIANAKEVLAKAAELLEKMERPWSSALFEETFRKLAQEQQLEVRDMFQLLRVSIAGQLVTPPLFESVQIMGEDEVLERVKSAAVFAK